MKTNYYRRHKKPGTPINRKQITIIKMAVNHLRIDDDSYRDMLEHRYGVRSCTGLTYDQASAFIKELEGKGFVLIPKTGAVRAGLKPAPARVRPEISRSNPKIIALVSRDELEKVEMLAGLIHWKYENGLALFLEKRMGIKEGRVRTSEHAYLAIEGLKKMFINGMKKQHGPAWWRLPFDDPAIMEFISIHCPEEWR